MIDENRLDKIIDNIYKLLQYSVLIITFKGYLRPICNLRRLIRVIFYRNNKN